MAHDILIPTEAAGRAAERAGQCTRGLPPEPGGPITGGCPGAPRARTDHDLRSFRQGRPRQRHPHRCSGAREMRLNRPQDKGVTE